MTSRRARGIPTGPEIAELRSWLQDLARFSASLAAAGETAAPIAQWLAVVALLLGEYNEALEGAIDQRRVEAVADADRAYRTLTACRNDAHTATRDKSFPPLGTPAPPSQHPRLVGFLP